MTKSKVRCSWAGVDPLMIDYHDKEWGRPVYDDIKLFEFLVLEGAQAGLSWKTILHKREHYRNAFDQFDPIKISRYSQSRVAQLLDDPGIVRNRLKIQSAIINAHCFMEIKKEFGSFSEYLWKFVGGRPIRNCFKSALEIPAETLASGAMSKNLKKRGFRFVGPTICYALMQAVGMVNDHTEDCYRYKEV